MANETAATTETATTTTTEGADKSILETAVAPKAAGTKAGEPNATPKDGSDKPAGDKDAGKTGTEGATGAPEKYDFKAPEGITFDQSALDGFSALAKSLNLSQDSAQKLVDFQATQIKAAQEGNLKTFGDMQKEWKADTQKALGADADKQLSYAAAFRDKFLSGEARKILNDSGLANHPEIVKSFIAAGKAISEDTFVEGTDRGKGDGTKGSGKTAAQIIYPNQK